MTFALKAETPTNDMWDETQKQLYKEISKTFPNAKHTTEGVIIEMEYNGNEGGIWEFRNKLAETLGFYINVYKPKPTQTFNVGTI